MDNKIIIAPSFYIYLAMMTLILPLPWFLSVIIAGILHELCHLAAIALFRIRMIRIEIHIGGARIITEPMSPFHELICSLAGPLGALTMLSFNKWVPLISICCAVQSAFNLFPVYPWDGGRALLCLMQMILPEKYVGPAAKVVCWSACILLGFAAVYCTIFLQIGLLPLLIAALPVQKLLAKRRLTSYNRAITDSEVRYDRKTAKNPAHRAKARPLYRR